MRALRALALLCLPAAALAHDYCASCDTCCDGWTSRAPRTTTVAWADPEARRAEAYHEIFGDGKPSSGKRRARKKGSGKKKAAAAGAAAAPAAPADAGAPPPPADTSAPPPPPTK